MSDSSSDQPAEALCFTLRELNERTQEIVDEVNGTGRPALITRHGRFLAAIYPIKDGSNPLRTTER